MIGLDVIFGGITGLLGNVITGITNYKTKKLEVLHEEKMVALESEAMRLEAEMNIAVTKAEIEGEIELADSAAYIESIKAGQTSLFGKEWIDKWGEYVAPDTTEVFGQQIEAGPLYYEKFRKEAQEERIAENLERQILDNPRFISLIFTNLLITSNKMKNF